LEESTRGFIELFWDDLLKEDILDDIQWIPAAIPISSMRELAIGYAIGFFAATSSSIGGIVESKKHEKLKKGFEKLLWAMIKRRLPEIVEKVERELNR